MVKGNAEESLNGRMQRRVESECKCCHQCQRGRLLAISVNRQRMLVIDGNSEDDRQTGKQKTSSER
jgi:hypothetical protein